VKLHLLGTALLGLIGEVPLVVSVKLHLLGTALLGLIGEVVEPTGIEPVTQRCERCVIPLYYGPKFSKKI
jgi:hypothetical protein